MKIDQVSFFVLIEISMKVFISIIFAVIFVHQNAYSAGYVTGNIKRFYNSGNDIYFGLQDPFDKSKVCTYFQEHFRFDATTPEGKTMFATLMASKLEDRSIAVWFQESTLPGTNHETGCQPAEMAVMTSIGLY